MEWHSSEGLFIIKELSMSAKRLFTKVFFLLALLFNPIIPAGAGTAAAPDEYPGGPILVVAAAANPFGRYYAEILWNEGLNAFTVADISTVDTTLLSNYQVVILGEMPLTTVQVTTLTDWVQGGGNLIAMRPDKQLAGLLGLTDAGGTLDNGYLLVNMASGPGVGIVGETIQYHGTADLYTLNGATAVAGLYSDADTATGNPAVTLRQVGSNGGQAAAFTYDLARSVVYTRQGNPAWAGLERDGTPPKRSDDMFVEGSDPSAEPSWVDLNKITIPQADEQQRLLANMILEMNLDHMPLPRFWYFPRGEKAVVIMTSDDHGSSNVTGRFDRFIALSPSGCSVPNWECVRASAYIYPNTQITNAEAVDYTSQGFEIGVHITTGCLDFTASSLAANYDAQLADFTSAFPSLPLQDSERTHCVTWSDWAGQAAVKETHGIRLDTNYYYWPPSLVQDVPGLFTGSGMPMRFADVDGSMFNVYQATTQMTDEAEQTYPDTIDTLLNRALGPQGYYGVFTANIHTDDGVIEPESEAIISSALSHNVPVVSGRQMLTWLDGRNSSSFQNLSWSADTLSFNVSIAAGANGLEVMVPMVSSNGSLGGISLDGNPVSYSTETIKGVEYATFLASAGTYAASYVPDTTAPVISNVAAAAFSSSTASITWDSDEASDSLVEYGTDAGALNLSQSDPSLVMAHSLTLTGLSAQTTYYYRVTSNDAAANSATEPPAGDAPLSFTTPSSTLVDTTSSDFSAGTSALCYISESGDGEVVLAPAEGAEFGGTALPSPSWSSTIWIPGSGGSATVNGGLLNLDGARARAETAYDAGHVLEFVATINPTAYQTIGFGGGDDTFNTSPWAVFGTGAQSSVLYASTWIAGGFPSYFSLGSGWFGSPHTYKIEWLADQVNFYIDGAPKHSETVTIAGPMRIAASDYTAGGDNLAVDWMRMSPYESGCTFQSRVFDSGGTANWGTISWNSLLPAGTALAISVRTGDTLTPDGTWSGFSAVANGGPTGGTSRYIQYQADLSSGDALLTPALSDLTIGYIAGPDSTPPAIVGRSPALDATGVAVDTDVTVTFNEAMDPATIDTSSFRLRSEGSGSDVAATVTYEDVTHTATLNPDSDLAIATTYHVTVAGSVADTSGNPLGGDDTWSFTAAAGSLTDTSVSDFSAGTPGLCYISESGDGEVILAPTAGSEFSGTGLPSGWTQTPWSAGGSATVSGGVVTVSDSLLTYGSLPAAYGSGRVIEFAATMEANNSQHIGLGTDLDAPPWAIFSTGFPGGTTLKARSAAGITQNETDLSGVNLGVPHLYRIEWLSDTVNFYVDGGLVASHATAIPDNMRPVASDISNPGPAAPLILDWMQMSPYASGCTFESRIFDAGQPANWMDLITGSQTPGGTAISFETRSSAAPDGTWSDWQAVDGQGAIASPDSQYLQYRASLATSDSNATPALESASITFSAVVANRAPLAVDDNFSTDEDTQLTVAAPGVLDNDVDPDGDTPTAALASDVSHGTLTLNSDGLFDYTPDPNFNGLDSFTYVANDGEADSNAATVTITVNSVNDGPVADANGPYMGTVGVELQFNGSGSSDVDGSIAAYSWDFGDGNIGNGASPTHTYAAAGTYTATLTVTDDGGAMDSDSASATILAPNQAPVAAGDDYTTDEDGQLTVLPPGVLGNDGDPDGDPLTAILAGDVSNGILSLNGDGSFDYTPQAGFHGTDSFTYNANDGQADSNTATVTITVNPRPTYIDGLANSDIFGAGKVSGDYTLTHEDDGNAEAITEEHSGGQKDTRFSQLEHKWTFNVAPGNVITLYANTWSSGSTDGDSFIFAFSSDGVTYTDMFTVDSTAEDNQLTYVLPASIQGSIYLRVTDSNHFPGYLDFDTIYVDYLYIRSEEQPEGGPPAAPSDLIATALSVGQIQLTWSDNATDEYGFYIERSEGNGNWSLIDTVGADTTAYVDASVFPSADYYYRVQAYNGSGSSEYVTTGPVTTPEGLNLTANGYKVKGIQMTDLAWEGGTGAVETFDVYRNSNLLVSGIQGYEYTDNIGVKGGGSYQYQVCEAGNPLNCSNVVEITF
jgi:VCBS repeat-containing protein